jgi:hypothetical protein
VTEQITNRGEVMNPPVPAAQGTEARNLNTPQRHGTGAVPQGGEAQATQHPAAPIEPRRKAYSTTQGGPEFDAP